MEPTVPQLQSRPNSHGVRRAPFLLDGFLPLAARKSRQKNQEDAWWRGPCWKPWNALESGSRIRSRKGGWCEMLFAVTCSGRDKGCDGWLWEQDGPHCHSTELGDGDKVTGHRARCLTWPATAG